MVAEIVAASLVSPEAQRASMEKVYEVLADKPLMETLVVVGFGLIVSIVVPSVYDTM